MNDVASLFDEVLPPLSQQLDTYYEALNFLNIPVWVFDIDYRRVYWANDSALFVWKADNLEELLARDMGADMSLTVAQRLAQYQQDFISQPECTFTEQWTLYPLGLPVVTTVIFSGHRLADGRMGMLCEARPIDEHAPESRRSVEALLHTSVMITLYSREGIPLYRNPAARSSTLHPEETLQDRIQHSNQSFSLSTVLSANNLSSFSLPVDTPHGARWHEISARVCRDAVSGQEAILVSETDITSVKETEAMAHHQAMHDSLTGLPNRIHAMEHFDRIISSCDSGKVEAAMLFIDLDRFKDVNDSLGHNAGDELLVEISERLKKVIKKDDLLARLGGDEFLIMRACADVKTEVLRLKVLLLNVISTPVLINGVEVRVTPSIGVSLFPNDGNSMETLLRHADLAMYSAKEAGRNGLAFYHAQLSEQVVKRVKLESDLRLAFERKEFVLHYQPRVSVQTGKIIGVEALVRWYHPERGLVFPDAFIPICESNGMIRQLGKEVLDIATKQQAIWAQQGQPISVAINISPQQIKHDGFFEEIVEIVMRNKCNPRLIELEITESTLLGNDQQVHNFLSAVESMGMSIALDDFGVGYSNLIYLQRFPIKTLKIDKSFIQGLEENKALASLVVSMCQLMGFTAVAEGVETEAQMKWVAEQAIEEYQGYYFSKPLPLAEINQLLAIR
ncbi:EAL domain-containing protein [Leeia sp. TBRC 13508]|uniref:EAL domain-containing protein n=1 Tax=Leeia speluncae TaxID=2884804 RepID=A0ABS8D312_9NEIS|nr:EAL domain-containing protein [Leeia speluncae]MCB6182555.1 EAL domain-containing protein [Leeia speluncae]